MEKEEIKNLKEKIKKINIFKLSNLIQENNKNENQEQNFINQNINENFPTDIKIQKFIKEHNTDTIKFILMKSTKSSVRKLERFDYYNLKRRKIVSDLIGTGKSFNTLIYKSKNDNIYIYTFKRIGIKVNKLFFKCSDINCFGNIEYNLETLETKLISPHTLPFKNHNYYCSSKINFLKSKLKNGINTIICIIYMNEPKIVSDDLIKTTINSKLLTKPNINEKRVVIKIDKLFDSDNKISYKDIFEKFLGLNRFLDIHFHKNNNNLISSYIFYSFNNSTNSFIFVCSNKGCESKALYDYNTKNFHILKGHTLNCWREISIKTFNNSKNKEVFNIFKNNPNISDIQFITEVVKY